MLIPIRRPRTLTVRRVDITNRTPWRTEDLRRLVAACARELGVKHGKHATFTRAMGDHTTGYAHLGIVERREAGYVRGEARTLRVRIPSAWEADLTADRLAEVAWVIEHELLHTMGVDHADMTPTQMHRPEGHVPRWLGALTLRLTPAPAPAPKLTPAERAAALVAKRAAKARAYLEKHERLLERERALVAKWARKVRYYEQREAGAIAATPRRKAASDG